MGILILSNGKGEDSLAVTLLKAIEDKCKNQNLEAPKIDAVPLIGDGSAYSKAGYNFQGMPQNLPSHGFVGLNPLSLIKDIKAGLLKTASRQIKILKDLSKGANFIICVGDIYPVLLSCFFTDKPIVHLATAVSVNFRKYNFFEIRMFKTRCKVVFTRDTETEKYLLSKGVNAKYFGNIMMDDPNLQTTGVDLGIAKDKKIIGLLPSSREDAYINICRMLEIMSLTETYKDIEFILSFSKNLDLKKLKNNLKETSWDLKEGNDSPVEIGKLCEKTGKCVRVISGHFGDVVKRSTLVIGMTGTGNEQAAGLGTPLVLIESGTSASKKRIDQYKKLLGDAVIAPRGTAQEIAKEIRSLIDNNEKLEAIAKAGIARMGKSGASGHIARIIIDYLKGP